MRCSERWHRPRSADRNFYRILVSAREKCLPDLSAYRSYDGPLSCPVGSPGADGIHAHMINRQGTKDGPDDCLLHRARRPSR